MTENFKTELIKAKKSNELLQRLIILKEHKNQLKGWKITYYQAIKRILRKIRFQERKATGDELNQIEKLIGKIGYEI